jgi:hypothetical protein
MRARAPRSQHSAETQGNTHARSHVRLACVRTARAVSAHAARARPSTHTAKQRLLNRNSRRPFPFLFFILTKIPATADYWRWSSYTNTYIPPRHIVNWRRFTTNNHNPKDYTGHDPDVLDQVYVKYIKGTEHGELVARPSIWRVFMGCCVQLHATCFGLTLTFTDIQKFETCTTIRPCLPRTVITRKVYRLSSKHSLLVTTWWAGGVR